MSLFRKSDYSQASKKNKVVSPRRASHGGITTSTRVKIPTQYKSQNHKCALCTRRDAKKFHISLYETRWLCSECTQRRQNKDVKEKPHFISARKLWRQS